MLTMSQWVIRSQATHPDRVHTNHFDLHGRTLDISPCVRLPKGKSRQVPMHNKVGPTAEGARVVPFGHIQREGDRTTCNSAMASVSLTRIDNLSASGEAMQLEEPMVVSDERDDIPVCTNIAALAEGTELVVQSTARQFGSRGERQTTTRTWNHDKYTQSCARVVN